MLPFATDACLQVSVFILVWDWKKSRMFLVNYNTNLFKVRVSLPSIFVHFSKQIKTLVDPQRHSLHCVEARLSSLCTSGLSMIC